VPEFGQKPVASPDTANNFIAILQQGWKKPSSDITGCAGKEDFHYDCLT
jgi:hypothetical protein